jgi:microcin C transport system permease protein
MRNYIIKRILAMIPMFFIMTGVFFVIQNNLPGGPVQEALARIRGADGGGGGGATGRTLSTADIDQLRKDLERQYGLDKPVHVRYLNWVKAVATLDFGDSITTRRPAMETIVSRFPVSLGFGLPGFFLTYLICVPLGVAKALRDGSKFDWGSSVILFVAYSVPALVASVVFLLVFCTDRVLPGGALFPLGGLRSDGFENMSMLQQMGDYVWHMFLPVCASLLGGFTVTTLLMKNSLLEVIRSDYVRTARSKGLGENTVIFKHALRNAILPLMVGIGTFLSTFVAGSIVIESVFGLPGMGLLFLDAITSRDFNVMMGVVVLLSMMIMFGQLISDIAYVAVDPRIDFN